MFRARASLVAIAFLIAIGPYGAAADPAHENGSSAGAPNSHAGQAGSHEGHGSGPAEPADLGSAWAALGAARDAIAADAESGSLKDIHAKSEPLPAMAQRLLDLSPDLAADKRARVEGAVKQVARVADALHVAADKGDAARTRAELGRLDGLLELIAGQYPAGALDSMSHHDHGEHHGAAGSSHHGGTHSHVQRPSGAVEVEPEATIRIRALDTLRFEPADLTVEAGVPTRIELENIGAAEHSLVVKTRDGKQDWIHLHAAGGGTAADTVRLDEPGTYAILCTIPGHTEGGMVGQLVVPARKSAEVRSPH
jgi:uncharacterized cupredoxin-like copper-binding protein